MYRTRQQDGVSVIAVIFGFVAAGILVVLTFKILPVYMEYYSVVSSLKSLEKELDAKSKSKRELMTMLKKRLDINDVKRVGKEDITINKRPRQTTIRVDYEVLVPLVSNVDLLMTFDKSATLH